MHFIAKLFRAVKIRKCVFCWLGKEQYDRTGFVRVNASMFRKPRFQKSV